MELLHTMNGLLVQSLGPMGPMIAVGALGLLLVLITLLAMPKKAVDPMEKFRQAATQAAKGGELRAGAAGRDGTRDGGGRALRSAGRTDKLEKFSSFLEPQDEKAMSAARLKMLQAGYRSKEAVRMLHAAQFVLGLGLLGVGVLVALLNSANGKPDMNSMILSVLVPGAIGYYLPRYWVERRRKTRQQEIVNGFPDALDMMLVCVEAGQSLDQSILRVSKEIRAGYPALADEFEMVSHEVKAGKERVQVLKDFSERAGVADVSSFVTVLIQSATFGTSIAEALRVYAGEMRDKRVMRAEEKANVLPTKLTLGTMMFTVPPLMIILIGPSVHGIAKTLGSAGFGSFGVGGGP